MTSLSLMDCLDPTHPLNGQVHYIYRGDISEPFPYLLIQLETAGQSLVSVETADPDWLYLLPSPAKFWDSRREGNDKSSSPVGPAPDISL